MHFVTFADSRYNSTRERIIQEAIELGFEEIFAYDETILNVSDTIKEFIATHHRGYGYWIWKPYVILKALAQLKENEVLVYADAGCKLNIEGKSRLLEYEDLCRQGKGLLTFSMIHLQGVWTKMDTLERVGGNPNEKQCLATTMIMINKPEVKDFMKKWWEYCISDNFHLVDDSPSIKQNIPEFRENRHDQSIFSLMAYQFGATIIDDEVNVSPNQYESKKQWPIHKRRIGIPVPT